MTANRPNPVEAYLSELPEDRRCALTRVRSVIRKHLPRGFEETMPTKAVAKSRRAKS